METTFKTLPTEFIIKTLTKEQTNECAHYYKNNEIIYSQHLYVYVSSKYAINDILWNSIHQDVEDLPIISFDNWKVLINPSRLIGYSLNKDVFDSVASQRAALEALVKLGRIYTAFPDSKEDLIMSVIFNNSQVRELIKMAGIMHWLKEVYAKDFPMINGYPGILSDDCKIIKYGCVSFKIEELRKLRHTLENISFGSSRTITSVTLNSGVILTIKNIDKILWYIK